MSKHCRLECPDGTNKCCIICDKECIWRCCDTDRYERPEYCPDYVEEEMEE